MMKIQSMIRSIGLAMAALVMALLLWSCGGEKSESLSTGMTAELAQLPAGFDGLMYANVTSMKESMLFKMMVEKHAPKWETNPEIIKFREETGFDPFNDVKEVYLAFSAPETPHDKNALIIAKGEFDTEKLRNYLNRHLQAKPIGDSGYEGYRLKGPHHEEMLMSLVDENRIVLGKEDLLEAYLTRLKNPAGAGGDYAALVKPVRYKSGAWMSINTAGMIEKVISELERDPDIPRMPALEHVKFAQWSMKADDTFNFQASGDFGEAEYAGLFHDTIKGALAAYKIALSQDRDAIDIVNKIEVKTRQNRVEVEAHLTQAELQKLMEHRPGGLAQKF